MSEKLVRDNMPKICQENAGKEDWTPMTFRYATPLELAGLLMRKITEEVMELEKEIIQFQTVDRVDKNPEMNARRRNSIMHEVADVREAIEGLIYCLQLDMDQIVTIQENKREHRGGFRNGIVWDGKR